MEQVANETRKNIQLKQANEQISGKIQELEDCAAQTKEVRKDNYLRNCSLRKYQIS
jgi:hypothetical protein